MKTVTLYTTGFCGYCVQAKTLLTKLGVTYEEKRVDLSFEAHEEMQKRTNGARKVPQIFIDDLHVGGFDDLHALHHKGELQKLLADDQIGD